MSARLFAAIDMPARVRDALAPALQACAAHGRASHPEDLHLTLRFLGALEPAHAVAVSASLGSFLRAVPRFPVHLEGGGGFPDLQSATTLWAAAHAPDQLLERVAAGISQAVMAVGLMDDGLPFVPHVTLCRPHGGPLPPELLSQIASLPRIEPFEVDHVVLMESGTGTTPRYTRVKRFEFAPRT